MSRRTLVGVEITQEGVRAAEVTTGAFPALVAWGQVALPPGAARDSEVRERTAVSAALAELWERAGFSGRRAVLGLGSTDTLVSEVSLPSAARKALTARLPMALAAALPHPPEQSVMDFYPLAEEAGTTRGFLVASATETVDRMIQSFGRARAQVVAVDLVAFGLARIARTLGHAGEATMIVHIGDHTTHIVVAVGGVPRLVRSVSARMLTSAAVRRASVGAFEPEPAVAVVTDAGGRAALRVGTAVLARPVEAATEPGDPASVLARTVRSAADEYRRRTGGQRIAAVFVSGAGSAAPGVEAALSAALKRPMRRVSLDQLVSVRSSPPDDESARDLVSTVGLVIGDAGR